MTRALFAVRRPVSAVVLAAGLLACSSQSALSPGLDAGVTDGPPVTPDLPADRTTNDVGTSVDAASSADTADTAPAADTVPPVSCFGLAPAPMHTAKIAGSEPPPAAGAPAPPPSIAWGDPRQLSSAELAGRLSRFLWRAAPDDALLAKVAACPNITRDDLQVLVRQMLADDRAVAGVEAFFTWWLALDSIANLTPDAQLFPGVTPQLLQSLADEPRRFGVDVVRGTDPSLLSLLASSFSFVDGRLAALYGLSGIDPSAPFQKVLFNPAALRAGLLTMPGILAQGASPTQTAPFRRALFVRQRLLCQPIPPPPPGIPSPPNPVPGQTQRQLLEMHLASSGPACAACHNLLAVGFAFENFDALGRLRGIDNGGIIDASGTIALDGRTIRYSGPVDLAVQLSALPEISECFARQWLAFALNRADAGMLDSRQSSALLPAIQAFRSMGLDIRGLIAMVASTAPFLLR